MYLSFSLIQNICVGTIVLGGDFVNGSRMFKGICLGMASVIAVGMIGEKVLEGKMKKPMKKKMSKAIHAMEEMVDTASYMFR